MGKSWKQTLEFQELNSILNLVLNNHEVIKVVGIASGSIEFGPESHDDTHRSAVQHSIMITLKDIIEDITNKGTQCYARDPCYTAVDAWAFADHGCEVLEDP